MNQKDTSVLNEFENLCISEIRVEDVLQEYNMSADSLKNIAEQLKIEENRKKLENDDWLFYEKLTSAANNCLKNRTSINLNPFHTCLYADIFRCLRNSSAGIINNQRMILRSRIFRNAINIFENFMALYFSEEFKNTIVTTLQCSLQFIGNLVYQYNEAKIAVWEIFYSFRYFSMLLASENIKVKECTAMVFYNCLTTEHRSEIVNKNDIEIIMNLSQLLTLTESEWSLFALDYFLQEEEFIVRCYKSLPIKNRLLLLDIIAEKLDVNGNDVNLSELMINFISDNFKSKAMDIVKICLSSDSELNSLEIARTLLLLCKATVIPKFEKLKIDRKLLETTIDTLKVVHLLGKSENNLFSPITSLKVEDSNYDAESHSSYGFKRNLIRLIANFCSENLVNQNIVREMDAIPLILDCCNIDSQNPFILQWCVLCLRNLMHKNSENQLLLAQLTIAEGMAESTQTLLKEMGLRVEYQEGELKLLSLHSENNLEL